MMMIFCDYRGFISTGWIISGSDIFGWAEKIQWTAHEPSAQLPQESGHLMQV
jgi:hypothetical protein